MGKEQTTGTGVSGQPGVASPGLPQGYDARREAQTLLRTIRAGTLATIGTDGFPFATLVNVATAMDGAPLLLLSGLSAHTQNLLADRRVSILLAATGKGDPLAHPRLTVIGEAKPIESSVARELARTRFLARHPKSALYAGFGDFGFWRLEPRYGHLNGGFARAAQLTPEALLTPLEGAAELETAESEAVEHMNSRHREAVAHFATALLGQRKGRWRATGLDPEGVDLALGSLSARLMFPGRVHTAVELRQMLARLARMQGPEE